MKTNGDILCAHADKIGLSFRTLEQVKAGFAQARKNKCEASMARLMLNHGRLTDEARAWVAKEYPQ